jgi:regulator of protease activity HflC (stomatin/prohibitin superfamily)
MSGVQTTLVQQTINDMSQAISIFSRPSSLGELPLVLIPSRGCCSWWMVIPDGCHIIMHYFGKDVEGYQPGLHILPPWYRIAYLVSKQATAYNAPVKNCPTKDNVMVQVDLTLVFTIVNARDFVYLLGAVKFNDLLRAAAEESIRGLVRSVTHDKAYELRGSRASAFIKSLNDKFEKFGINFSDATITNVSLPQDLAQTLETETTYDSKQKEELKSHQYELKLLNDQADLQLKELRAKNEREVQDETAKKERALIKRAQAEIEAQKQKEIQIIKAESEAAVLKYKAESEYINAKIEGEKEAALLILKAEGDSQAGKIRADQQAQVEEKRSAADLIAAQNRAKALEVEADAEAKAASQLREKREYEIAMKRLEVMEKLAQNTKLVISGQNGDKISSEIIQALAQQLQSIQS